MASDVNFDNTLRMFVMLLNHGMTEVRGKYKTGITLEKRTDLVGVYGCIFGYIRVFGGCVLGV